MDCIVLGDSIAQGLKKYAHCVGWQVEQSISSVGWNAKWGITTTQGDLAVISLGSNDGPAIDTAAQLEAVRSRITAKEVVWILPAIERVQQFVRTVAGRHGDRIVSIVETRDGVHPTANAYRRIAQEINR